MTSRTVWHKLLLMKRVLLSLAVAFLLVAPSVFAHESEQDSDQESGLREGIRKNLPAHLRPNNNVTSFHRRAVDSSEMPWQTIGRVNIGGRAHCSGTLVAANIVLTAAHCLFSKASQQMVVPGVVHFVAGYSKGEYLAHSKIRSYRVGDGYRGEDGATRANISHDWALLVLEEPLGEELGFLTAPQDWFAVPSPNDQPSEGNRKVRIEPGITTAGYPGDRGHVLSLEENCRIITTANKGRIIFTSCVALRGDSGGPILQQKGEDWHIIGVQTSALTAGDKVSGVGLSAIVYQPYLDILSE